MSKGGGDVNVLAEHLAILDKTCTWDSVCIYVCVCDMRLYVYTRTCTHTHMHMCWYMSACVHVCVYMCACVYILAHVAVNV